MSPHANRPLTDAELNEIERYTTEALAYRHQPEFVHDCARLIAEVRRLREGSHRKGWNLGRFGRDFIPQHWFSGFKQPLGG